MQIVLCSGDKPPLFSVVHGFGRTAEAAGAPEANLHEDETSPVAHDEVDFAETTPMIAPDQAQPLPAEEIGGEALLVTADIPSIGG